MNGELTIRDIDFSDEAEDDLLNDPDYQPSELGTSSDVSMVSAAQSTTTATDISIPNTIPSDAMSVGDVSDIFPDDSISQRDAKIAAQQRKYHRPPSEASEAPSVISFHSSADGFLYKELHGRAFTKSDHYMLPADDDEHSRLDLQHLTLRLHLNGALYPWTNLVEHALREGQESQPAVLDVGTGSGRWAIDIAAKFPHVDVIGLDLVPPATLSEDDVPPNCRFEVDDANLTFEHYEGCFNLIHVRSTEAGINDFEGFLYEIAKIMKPWGVLILVTGYPQIYDIDAKPFPVVEEGEPGFSWLQHNFYQCYKAYQNRNNSAVDASLYWHDYLESNPNFTSPKTQDTFIPLGPFKPNMSEYEKKVSNLMREDIMHIMSAFKPLLVGDGHKEEDVDRWIANSVQELQELRICGHIKWRYTVAIRKNLPWQERMEQPEPVEPRTGSLVVRKSPRGSVVSGCSTNITARTHSTGTVYPPTVTTWAMGVPPGPPELHFRSN